MRRRIDVSMWWRALLRGAAVCLLALGCTQAERSYDQEQEAVDRAFARLSVAIEESPGLEPFLEIDHRRRGMKAGASMPPARVSLFRARESELDLVSQNPRAAIELPLRALVYSDPAGVVQMAYNPFDFVRSRHRLAEARDRGRYDEIFEHLADVVRVPAHATAEPKNDEDGLIVNDAEGSVPEVVARLKEAVEATDGAVYFGEIDYQAEAESAGRQIRPLTLVLFGNPGVGAPAMSDVPELGLDQFCQKVVVWEDQDGVHTAHNDIAWQAERRGESMSLARRKVRLGLGATVAGAAGR